LGGEILIYDLGSTDQTVQICKKYGISAHIVGEKNLSAVRNRMITETKEPWLFYIEPWEVLARGYQDMQLKINGPPAVYGMMILDDNVVTKDARLWHKSKRLKFKNPVYETLDVLHWENTENIILSQANHVDKLNEVKLWRESAPNSKDALYYEALCNLSARNYKEFKNLAQHYLFKETESTISRTMLEYYNGIVLCHVDKKAKESSHTAIRCLARNCLMAEFWCLLGDIYYNLIRDYKKAQCFYENAIALGARRLKTDDWPMDMQKYKEYPITMIESCKRLIENKIVFAK
jgi:glycosyltransferase involved in cell wall biosynthesis